VSEDRLLTIRDLVERTQLSRSTVMGLLARGDIASLTIRRARRIRESTWVAFIEARASAQAERLLRATPGVEPGAATEAGHSATPLPE
jgi:predicted DNA-binding transcriptional regulator AlpA